MFPHSEIRGSKLICSSPRLIAACHVLHRLLMPRHSPYALVRLNFLHRSLICDLSDLCCSQFLLNCLSFLNIGYFAAKRLLSFLPYPPFGEIVLPLIGKTYFSSRQFDSTRSKSLSSLSVFSTLLRFIRFSMTSKPLGFCLMLSHLVGTSGLEPPTSRLSGARSNLLSYAPIVF